MYATFKRDFLFVGLKNQIFAIFFSKIKKSY